MNVKISPDFWSDPEIEALSTETKLATLWLLTNPRVNLAGYAEISEKRFVFDTGLSPEDLRKTFKALPKSFRTDGERGYWIRAFIRRQFGQGDALLRNNYCKPLLRDIKALGSASVVLWILDEYPELKDVYRAGEEGKALRKGSGSTTGAPEQNRTEQNSIERNGTARQGRQKKAPAPPSASSGAEKGEQIPPAPADVAAYFVELGSTEAEAVKFFDHYEANGWKQGGRAALRSWRAAARNWVRRSQDGGGSVQKNSVGPKGPVGDLPGGAGSLCIPDEDSAANEGGLGA